MHFLSHSSCSYTEPTLFHTDIATLGLTQKLASPKTA